MRCQNTSVPRVGTVQPYSVKAARRQRRRPCMAYPPCLLHSPHCPSPPPNLRHRRRQRRRPCIAYPPCILHSPHRPSPPPNLRHRRRLRRRRCRRLIFAATVVIAATVITAFSYRSSPLPLSSPPPPSPPPSQDDATRRQLSLSSAQSNIVSVWKLLHAN